MSLQAIEFVHGRQCRNWEHDPIGHVEDLRRLCDDIALFIRWSRPYWNRSRIVLQRTNANVASHVQLEQRVVSQLKTYNLSVFRLWANKRMSFACVLRSRLQRMAATDPVAASELDALNVFVESAREQFEFLHRLKRIRSALVFYRGSQASCTQPV
jgi:hypothetical protein